MRKSIFTLPIAALLFGTVSNARASEPSIQLSLEIAEGPESEEGLTKSLVEKIRSFRER